MCLWLGVTWEIVFLSFDCGVYSGPYEVDDELIDPNQLHNSIAERMLLYRVPLDRLVPLFAMEDVGGTGSISEQGLQQCFAKTGIILSTCELSQISNQCRSAAFVDGDEVRAAIEYKLVVHELTEAVARLEKECLNEYSSALSGNPPPRRVLRHAQQMLGCEKKLDLLQQMLRAKLADYLANSKTTACTLEQLFTEADEEGRGLLDANGLLDICAMVGLKVTWEELERLVFHADCSVDGSVDLEEFVRFIECA